jgi:hypothetical protein
MEKNKIDKDEDGITVFLPSSSAAIMNIFLDIPFFYRGVCQPLYGKVGPRLSISSENILSHIENVNPLDPTSVVEEYLDDW